MLYKPNKERQWDTWIFKSDDLYFMYYINVSDGGTRWDGISLATSKDLLHWTEYGRVLKKDDDAVWLGTGMIQKIGKTYIMNYSLEKPEHYQRIFFATSDDLYHWTKVENVMCAPDGVIYSAEPQETCDVMPRWDSLGVFNPLDENPPPYYAFCSANIKGAPYAQKSGVLGLITSDDGLNWKCLPPAFADCEIFPSCEVPEYVSFNGRHYALFCTSSYLGYRNDERADWASGGTYYVVADNATGPYRLPQGDPMLQGQRDHELVTMNYVGRVFKADGRTYYYHTWGELGADAWIGLVKELEEKEPYRLNIKYCEVNEKLKGQQLFDGKNENDYKVSFKLGIMPAVYWQAGSAVGFKNNGSSSCLDYVKGLGGCDKTVGSLDLRDGRVIDFDLSIDGLGAGIYFNTEKGRRAAVMLNKKKQRIEFGFIKQGWGGSMILVKDLYKDASINANSKVKIFARREFMECYIDGNFIGGWRNVGENIRPNELGFYSEDCDGKFDNIQVFEMV